MLGAWSSSAFTEEAQKTASVVAQSEVAEVVEIVEEIEEEELGEAEEVIEEVEEGELAEVVEVTEEGGVTEVLEEEVVEVVEEGEVAGVVEEIEEGELGEVVEVVEEGEEERLSLDLKGVDILELFRIISMKTGLTIVPSKNVSGRLSIYLNNVTLEDALDVILISQELACERKGDIINIMTATDYLRLYGKNYNEKRKISSFKLTYAKPVDVFTALSQLKSDIGKVIVDESSGMVILVDIPEKLELMEATAKELDQTPQTELFDLQYANIEDLEAELTDTLTTGPGQIAVDKRTNKVIVSDLPGKMKKIKQMVRAFDEESRQVLIEAEIVQLSLSDTFDSGLDWEQILSKTHNLNFKGNFPTSSEISAYQRLSIGELSADDYEAVLEFISTFGETNLLSRPRIAVLDNEEAKIMIGSREAYVSQTLSQAEATTVTSESVEFIDVGIKLTVVPRINRDGFVTMRIKPEVSSVRETLPTALGSKIPIVETSEAETVVKLKDGAMIVIAGLIKDEKRDERRGWPFLSKVPVLNLLFGSQSTSSRKTELLIFLTPHIISGEEEIVTTADISPPEEVVLEKKPKGMR